MTTTTAIGPCDDSPLKYEVVLKLRYQYVLFTRLVLLLLTFVR
jgi:hypothetical protein